MSIETWFCYILHSTNCDKTYNGSTNDPIRRLRQHNGEISGGAIATQTGRPYEFICIISGFSNHRKALSCEWWIRHPTGARKRPSQYCKPNGRIKGLNFLFQSNIWMEKFGTENLKCQIGKDYIKFLTDIPKNVIVEFL